MQDRIKLLDNGDMQGAIESYPRQIKDILATYTDWTPHSDKRRFNQVLYLGMGGSAIGGDLVRVWAERLSETPLIVVRDYRIPAWVNEHTLVVASSYSGNTEETLSAAVAAAELGSTMLAVASGGKLAELAANNGWDLITIPSGMQPRAAIGYSAAAICVGLAGFKVLPDSVLQDLETGAGLMEQDTSLYGNPEGEDNPALKAARLAVDYLPVIYGSPGTTETLAVRLRGQLAENSKIFASHHNIPEQNHNEIVGLNERLKKYDDAVVIWLTDSDDHERVALRRVISSELLNLCKSKAGEVSLAGHGATLLQRNLTLLYLIDWISFYAAILGDYDPSQIDILTRLKQKMSVQ
ncbi:MAG: bifunctional phosphoglucose/phosphomannose isomerase [Candidatus Marinimicrobia bacterium]|nr:bifunctional phosphoglucose/phosphomannose isomerase [Candidatus Neomarinimicrobiota bacterium]